MIGRNCVLAGIKMLRFLKLLCLLLLSTTPALADDDVPGDWPVYQPPAVQQLQAQEVARINAPEARQGVAVDRDHYYAVGNHVIAKYARATGDRVALWRGARGGPVIHLNACLVDGGELACAHSNYPHVPFANSVEWYDRKTLQPTRSKSLGVMDEGSLVWFDHVPEGWIVGLAHYSGEKGLGFKDSRFASVELYDPQWRRIGGWALPETLLDRIAPKAASGGAIGPGGYLYVMGHDLPEMYVLGKPLAGPTLVHIATIAIEAEGQAFDFDESRPGEVCAISRPNAQIRCFRLPNVAGNLEFYKPFN